MFFSSLALALLTPSEAHAQKYEVALTTSIQTVRDPRWEVVNASPTHTPSGIVAGMVVSGSTSVILGLNTGSAGSEIMVPTSDGSAEHGFNLAATLTHYQVGARYRWSWKERLVPTTTVVVQLGQATLRMDENIDIEGEEVETRSDAFSMGLEFGGGLEYTVAYLSQEQVRLTLGFEVGYTNLRKMKFKTTENGPSEASLGELNPGGPFVTVAVGTRF